jgi:hypothetical protein
LIGTESLVRTYASPTASTPDFTANYTIAETTTVNLAPAGSPGAFDLNTVANYTIVQPPLVGEATSTVTTDTYENQIASGSSLVIQNAGSKTVTVGDDVSANANGGGPYTETENTLSLYQTPQTVGTYPLVTGTNYSQPVARKVTSVTSIANAGGAPPPAPTFTTNATQSYNSDGSYTFASNLSNGDSQQTTESSNGTALLNETGPVQTLQETISAPSSAGAGEVIPVTIVRQTAMQSSPTTKTYSAVDWYPGGAQPAVPFDLVEVTVKGPAASLPGACAGAGSFPNVVEVDQTETTLNLFGSLTSTQQQRFDSNGLAVCRLTTTTTTGYSIETGLQTSATVEQTDLVLQSVGTSANHRAAGAQRLL